MNNYTKMCASLKELQEGWKSKIGDIVNSIHYGGECIFLRLYNESCVKILLKADGSEYFDDRENIIYKPTLEQLIGMLEDFQIIWTMERGHPSSDKTMKGFKWKVENCADTYLANTLQEAMLKLVAWELWGKTWNEDKEVWEDTNGE